MVIYRLSLILKYQLILACLDRLLIFYDAINNTYYTSANSFKEIDPFEKNSDYCAGACLDNIDINNVPFGIPSLYNITNNGPMYSIVISKLDNNNYSGILWSYADYTLQYSPWYFLYSSGYHVLKKLL